MYEIELIFETQENFGKFEGPSYSIKFEITKRYKYKSAKLTYMTLLERLKVHCVQNIIRYRLTKRI